MQKCPTQKTFRDGRVHESTMQKSRAGAVNSYRIVSSAIFDASGAVTATIEIVEDITEKLSLESQIRQSQKMEAVGRLAGGIAHDYNNILTVIPGYAEQAMDKVSPIEPLYDDLHEIFKATTRSAAITLQLPAFARKQVVSPSDRFKQDRWGNA
ncbi:MAG: hypothetical protein Q7U02_03655 [Desulfosalsimonadaceae bacterium]|nr:hypothetical protein [Desulfosalsimonadaceae bacterium]